jgi:hypothetical protein
MFTQIRFRIILAVMTASLVLLIAMLPATRWIARSQLDLALHNGQNCEQWYIDRGSESLNDSARRAEEHRVAMRQPGDYLLQLADAVESAPYAREPAGAPEARRIRSLRGRFPNNPSLLANALRYDMEESVQLHRPEERIAIDTWPVSHDSPVDPRALAVYLADAAAGERLDPDNGFFPTMAAIGLFAAHRDAEALAALNRAGACRKWNSFQDDELYGRIALIEEAYGRSSCLQRLNLAIAVDPAHAGQIRALVRTATGLAIEAEKAGRPEDGLAIRLALQRLSLPMRDRSPRILQLLLALHVFTVSTLRPGAGPAIHTPPHADHKAVEETIQKRAGVYADYLRKIGHPGLAAAFTTESDANQRLVADILAAQPRRTGAFRVWNDALGLAKLWAAGAVLLLSALMMFFLGHGAALDRGYRRLSGNPRLILFLRVPLFLVLVFVCPLVVQCMRSVGREATVPALAMWLAALICTAIPDRLALRMTGDGAVGLFAALGFMTGALGTLNALFAAGPFAMLGRSMLANVAPYDAAWHWQMVAFACAAAPPLALMVALAAIGIFQRRRIALTISDGLRAAAWPAVCALLLIYCVVAVFTANRESAVSRELNAAWKCEGRFTVREVGEPWPADSGVLAQAAESLRRGETR